MASKLSLMQARFQQKQMQEKEEKMLKLYENQQQRAIDRVSRGSAGSNTSTTSITSITSTQGGKVRQMFDERRQKAGIDRSYPLEPLKPSKAIDYGRGSNGFDILKNDKNGTNKTVVKTTVKRSVTHVKNGKPLVNKREIVNSIYNNNDGDESYEEQVYEDQNDNGPVLNKTYRRTDLAMMMNDHYIHDNIDDEEFPDLDIDEFDEPTAKPKLSNVGGRSPIKNGIKEQREEKVIVKNGSSSPRKVAGHQEAHKTPVQKTITITKAVSSASPTSSINKSPTKAMPVSQSSKSSQQYQKAPSANRPSSKPSGRAPSAVNRDDLEACKYCTRRFATDRLAVHEDICARTAKKKRKIYDATRHRVQGTELEPYTRKSNRTASVKPAFNQPEAGVRLSKQPNSKQLISKQSKQSATKKSDWRRKHEEFISAIRAAKMAQVYVAKGGKLSDLPPPPPAANPDYVQCPHCGRRFNETAAQRHIPKCATFEFNKPKQPPHPNSIGRNSKSNTSNR